MSRSQQPAYPVLCFEGQKVPYPASSCLSDIKLSWRNLNTVNMVEWQVTRQLPVRVTPLLYLVFLLMCLHKIVSNNFWTPCDVHFEKKTSVFGLGLGLAFRIRVLCQCLRFGFGVSVLRQGSVFVSKVRVYVVVD